VKTTTVRTGDPADQLLRLLPELALTLYEAAPHSGRGPSTDPLTRQQMRVVVHLAHHGSVTMGEMADALRIGQPAASELVARLEEKGVVRREQDDIDRRTVRVSLVGPARGYADVVLGQWRARAEDTFAQFPDVDPDVLVSFVRALIRQWQPRKDS
jgi:DNA-binding MarR family transcriptional regulator